MPLAEGACLNQGNSLQAIALHQYRGQKWTVPRVYSWWLVPDKRLAEWVHGKGSLLDDIFRVNSKIMSHYSRFHPKEEDELYSF